MNLNFTAEADTENGLVEFGGTFVGEINHDDCRPLFATAREVAGKYVREAGWSVESVTVTEISCAH